MKILRDIILLTFLMLTLVTSAAGVTFRRGQVAISTVGKMPDPVNLALSNLQGDFMKVMGFDPEINPAKKTDVQLLVVCSGNR